jgi:hypothetical protein
MSVADFVFPVLCFWKNYFRIEESLTSLVTTTTAGLRHGMFDRLLITDRTGKSQLIGTARKASAVGSMRGYNIFLNQSIVVKLIPDGGPFHTSVDEVRDRVVRGFGAMDDLYAGRDDFYQMKRNVIRANTIDVIIGALLGEFQFGKAWSEDLQDDVLDFLSFYFEMPKERFTPGVELSYCGLHVNWEDALLFIREFFTWFEIESSGFVPEEHYSVSKCTVIRYIHSRYRPDLYYVKPVTVANLMEAARLKSWQV